MYPDVKSGRNRIRTVILLKSELRMINRIKSVNGYKKSKVECRNWDIKMSTLTKRKTIERRVRGGVSSNWLDLASDFSLRPVSSETAHDKAVKIILSLSSLERMNKAQQDYFDVLTDLVDKYESAHHAIDTSGVSVADTLLALMEANDMTASDLGRLLGERTIGHKVLTGKRRLTVDQIKTLSVRFCVSADLFI
jgi:antitoxin component HigA of HigAB toxin-antitoxin module